MNEIHSTVIIEGDVQLGERNRILPYSVLTGPLSLGNGNVIGPHVVIGTPGEDTKNPHHDSSRCAIRIGDDNIIREFTVIQKPCYEEVTLLGSHIFLMHGVHIPHDALLEDHVVIAPMAMVGGLAKVLAGATIAMGASLHQHAVIGQYSIVAMGAAAMKNVKPFSRFIPGKPVSVNTYALQKYGFTEQAEEISAYVLHDEMPTSPKVKPLIERYRALHARSKRDEYR